MALSWIDFINGEALSSVRSKINSFNTNTVTDVNTNTGNITTNTAGIATNVTNIATNTSNIATNVTNIATNTAGIATNVTDIAALDVRVTANEVEIAHLEDSGMSVLSGSNIAPQTVNTSATAITSFDTLAIEVGVGTTGSVINQSMTADSAGVFKLRYESFLSYASNVTITWQIYKNGSPFGNSVSLSGKGANVFTLILISAANLLANDELKLYGTASASTSLTIAQANGTLEKTHF